MHPDPDLAGARRRVGNIIERDDLAAAGAGVSDCAHGEEQ
jgi:hypothetical protein